jgi:hypothetical protein
MNRSFFRALYKKTITNAAILSTALLFSAALSGTCLAQSAPTSNSRRIWSVSEILNERQFLAISKKPKYCGGRLFKPCVCAADVPSVVQYRPQVRECGRKAAIILSGRYKDVFSVVVRDWENKDRWPVEGINGCTAYERDVLALHRCSAFKAQKVLQVNDTRGDATVHCLGASGRSRLFRRVVRMTAKLSDIPNSTADPLARWCLKGPTEPLN